MVNFVNSTLCSMTKKYINKGTRLSQTPKWDNLQGTLQRQGTPKKC